MRSQELYLQRDRRHRCYALTCLTTLKREELYSQRDRIPNRRGDHTGVSSHENDLLVLESFMQYAMNSIPLLNELLIVSSRRRNCLILFKRYHAEIAGPGAAVGGLIDRDCQRVLPVGNLSLISPESSEERQRAYLIRRQWVRLTIEIIGNLTPLQRAQKILKSSDLFESEIIAQLPDDALALLVGVLPETLRKARFL